MIRRWLPIAVGAGIVVWLAALVLLAITAEGSQRFGELYLVILLINVTGVIALLVLIGGRLADFIRDWRRHVPGSRLRGRTLTHVRRARDRAAPARVHVLRDVPDARHRQLVPRRGEAGTDRRGRTLAIGARPSHARVPRSHDPHRIAARGTFGRRALPRARRGAARFRRRGTDRHERGRPVRGLQPRGHAAHPSRRAARGALDAASPGTTAREPSARAGRRLPGAGGHADPRGTGAAIATAPHCDLSRTATSFRPRGNGAGGLQAVRAALVPARAAQGVIRADAVARAAHGAARRDLRRTIFLRAAGAPGPGPDRRHARSRQG